MISNQSKIEEAKKKEAEMINEELNFLRKFNEILGTYLEKTITELLKNNTNAKE